MLRQSLTVCHLSAGRAGRGAPGDAAAGLGHRLRAAAEPGREEHHRRKPGALVSLLLLGDESQLCMLGFGAAHTEQASRSSEGNTELSDLQRDLH